MTPNDLHDCFVRDHNAQTLNGIYSYDDELEFEQELEGVSEDYVC